MLMGMETYCSEQKATKKLRLASREKGHEKLQNRSH